MGDKYRSFSELAENESEGRDFRIRFHNKDSATVIIAPHGGGIEPGTSEIAEAIAADDLSFYAFDGIKPSGNRHLHVTSTRFDEPNCVALLEASTKAVSVHGEDSQDQVVFLGGRDEDTLSRLSATLEQLGFCVKKHKRSALQGQDPENICNRTSSGIGVQLELSHGLRRSFFRSLSKNGRQSKTQRFGEFVAAVREAIA